jgi:hypothetical protein
MHSVYMTHSPCVYTLSLHVCTQSVQNSASMGGDLVRDGGCHSKIQDGGCRALGMGQGLHPSML